MKNIKNQIGVVYVILSAILFGTMPLLARIAYAHGSNAYTVAFTRFFFGSIVLGAIIIVLPDCTVKISKRQFLTLLKLSAPYALTPILLYLSYTYLAPKTSVRSAGRERGRGCYLFRAFSPKVLSAIPQVPWI